MKMFLRPYHLWVQKVQGNSITAVNGWVSPRLDPHTYNDKVPFIGPHHLSKFWNKKPKATTKVAHTSHQICTVFVGLSSGFVALSKTAVPKALRFSCVPTRWLHARVILYYNRPLFLSLNLAVDARWSGRCSALFCIPTTPTNANGSSFKFRQM